MENKDKQSFNLTPKKLFIFDGVGALISAFMLGVLWIRFDHVVGIPTNTLYLLATFPVLFALFDLIAIRQIAARQILFLRIIALANLSYCLLSLGFAWHHHETLTTLGWIYIIAEVIIVASLAYIELRVAKKQKELSPH
jgi:hypothetical protein